MTKIIGAKSGGGKQRKPVIAPDSLQSTVYINMLYGLSEGEIAGLATGDEQSIYLDDTPLKNANGEWNFQNVTVDFRHGTNDQTYIEGFPDVASEVAVNVELKHSTPWVKSFNNLDLDAVRVRLKWGALKQQNAENGDVSGVRIQYAIDVKADSLAWQEVLNTEINAKTSTNYERSHRIDLPTAQRGWQIRVRRITPNSTSEYVSDKMYISAVTEVVDLKLRYPNTALLGLQYDAEHFSNVAKMAVRLKGLKIKVPSNYDPETRQYHGFWDGTFKREYSNNPAWIYYDICTADRYGLGERLKPFMVDKWSLYRLAQYCDEMVSDGNGGLEPRFTLNVYLQSADDAFAILSKMSGVFRAISYWNGQQIVCDADMPQDSMYSFSRANVIDGQFEYTGTRARDRHTVAKVAWDNKDNRFKTEYEFVRDEQAISKLGIKFIDIQAWGCTSKGQAQRAGWWALKSEQLETRMVSFKVGLDGYIPQPGKVIEISDELFAGRANGGRVSAINTSKNIISLDRAITAKAGDKLIINGENGRAETRIIQTVQNHQVTVTQPFDNIAVENVWVLDSKDLATMKFRVLSITQDEKHQFKITAVQYTPEKYQAIDTGAYIDERPISVINPKIQAPVTEVNIETEYRTVQGLNVATMIIHYPQVSGAVKYQVEWRKDNGNWIKLPITGANSVEVVGVYAGQYEARVIAISAFDVHSLATHSTLTTVQGKAGRPPKLANLTATGTLFGMRLDWAFSAKSEDTNYTEIQVSPDGRSNIATLGQFAYPTDTHQIQGLQGNLTQFYRAKIVDKLGNESDWTEWTSGTTSADPEMVLDLLEGQINESTLDNILTGKINTAVNDGKNNAQNLAQEIINRTNAIRAETTARTQAINTAIANEASNRTNAIRAESTARTQAINAEIATLNRTLTTDITNKTEQLRTSLNTQITSLQNGLTQEIQNRKDADNSTVSALNAYKVSNDNAVATVLQKAETAISVNNAQTTQINALQSNLTTVQTGLATKLDSAVISNYYTKAQADDKIQQVTTGKIEEFNANLTIGGVNILPNSHIEKTGANEHLYYAILPELKEFYLNNPVVTISFDIKVPVVGRVQVYSSNNSGVLFAASINVTEINVFKRYSVTVNPKPHPNNPNINQATLEFYGTYNTGRIPTVKNVKIESGNKATDWTPALSDVDGKINANAQAINTINSNVSNLNNTLTSQSQQLTQLRNDLTATNANVSTKADTTALNILDNKVTQQGNNITTQSNKITQLENSLNTVNQNLNTKANASALTTLDSKVSGIDGQVSTQANQITQLTSNLSTTNNQTLDALKLSAMITNGKLLYVDVNFKQGLNGVVVYNNSGNGSVIHERIAKRSNNPTSSTHEIKIIRKANMTSSPNLGGFHQNIQSAPNKTFVIKYLICLPVGYHLNVASNATGNGRIDKFIGDTAGTGKYETYLRYIQCGDTGSFSTSGHVHISGVAPTTQDLVWYLAQIECYEITDYQSVDGTVQQWINNATSSLTTLTNQQQSQSQQLTNLHNALNSTNATVSTKADATALNILDNRVTQTNDRITAESQKITALQNSLNTVNGTLNSKADSSALSNLNTTVQNINGTVTTQANQITQLESGLNTVNQTLNNKVNASALSDYYTKAQTDNVMSGKIDEFKSTLNNNDNLLLNSAFNSLKSWEKNGQSNRSSLEIINSNKRYNQVKITPLLAESDWKGIRQIVQNIDIVNQNLQVRFIATSEISRTISVGIHYLSSTNAILHQTWQSKVVHNETECIFSFNPVNNANITGVRFMICEVGNGNINQPFYIAQPSFAIGTQPITAWSPSIYDSIDGVNANAQAISTINSNVSNLNNTVTSQGQAITQLNNNLTAINANVSQKADSTALTALDNKVTQQGNNITSQANQITVLQSGLNTANQNIATKLDSSAIVNYYTKAETDNAMSGRIDTFRASINTEIAKLQKALKVTELDLRHLDANTYYPVTFTGLHHVEPRLIRISRNLDQYPEKPTWAKHNSGGFSLLCEWIVNSSGWGTIAVTRNITTFAFSWITDNQSPLINIGQLTNQSQEYCYLRGGARYKLETHDNIVATIRTTTHNVAGQTVAPMSYDVNLTPKSDKQSITAQITEERTARTTATTALTQQINAMNTTLNGQSTTITQQAQTINGISAVRAVTVDNNGVISGYGLMSELRNGRVTSQFGVNADTFYIGSPSNGKKPFIFNASPRVIDGVSYPAGAWINSAYIANATIKNAHIQDGTLETAKIKDGAITTAKIANASIDNAKIKNGSIQTAHIQDLAVGEIKIAHGSVTVGSLVSGKINAVPPFTILEVANKKILMLLKIKAKTTIDNRFSSSNLQYNPAFIIKRNGKEIKRYNAYMKQVGLKGGYQRWEGGDGGFVISSVEYACEFDINEYLCDLNLTGRQIYSFEFIDDVENGKWDSKSTNFINSSSVEVVFLELKK